MCSSQWNGPPSLPGIVQELNNMANSMSTRGEHGSAMHVYSKAATALFSGRLVGSPELRRKMEMTQKQLEVLWCDQESAKCYPGNTEHEIGQTVALSTPLDIPIFPETSATPDSGFFIHDCSVGVLLYNMGIIERRSPKDELSCQFYEIARELMPTDGQLLVSQPRAALVFASIMNNLGRLYLRSGRIAEASSTFGDGLLLLQSCNFEDLQSEDVYTRAKECLFALLLNQGRLRLMNAEPETAFECFCSALNSGTSDSQLLSLARCILEVGQACLDMRRFVQAAHVFKTGLSIRPRLSVTNGITAVFFSMMYKVGTIYLTLGNTERAMSSFSFSLRLFVEARTEEKVNAKVAAMLQDMAVFQHKAKHVSEARCTLLQVLEVRKMLYGDDHTLVAETLYIMGRIHQEEGSIDAAMACYGETLRIEQTVFGTQHPDVAVTRYKIGQCFRARGEMEKALQVYREVVDILKRNTGGRDHKQSMAQILQEIGDIHFERGELNDAVSAFSTSSRLFLEAAEEIDRVRPSPAVKQGDALVDFCDINDVECRHGAPAA